MLTLTWIILQIIYLNYILIHKKQNLKKYFLKNLNKICKFNMMCNLFFDNFKIIYGTGLL